MTLIMMVVCFLIISERCLPSSLQYGTKARKHCTQQQKKSISKRLLESFSTQHNTVYAYIISVGIQSIMN